ncbi:MAG: hypothetical protein HZA77_04665 [Candidatus Schekmanbacteria bacterium]|nr:hypothetical protein [Candidatus Schekmanbacteria bacterium]
MEKEKDAAEYRRSENNIPLRIIIIFLIFALCVISGGYIYYSAQKANVVREKHNELTAIADLKTKQIVNWRNERIADAKVTLRSPLIYNQIIEFLRNQKEGETKENILSWIASFKEAYNYKNIYLLDLKGNIVLPENSKKTIGKDDREKAEKALKTREIFFSDIQRDNVSNAIHLDLIIPVINHPEKNGAVEGFILLEIAPYDFLYPLIQQWPTPSKTAETLLVRREGDEVLYLNELRHRKNTAMTLRFSLSLKNLPAARAVLGKEGVYEGVDYRGKPVVAATHSVPGTPWFIVSKEDSSEVYASMQRLFWFAAIVVIVLIIAAGSGVGLMWRGQRLQYFRKQYETEMEKLKIEERYSEELKKSNEQLKRFAYIASHDLQEPLRMISSYLQLIERRYKGKLDKDADEFIAFAVNGADSLQKMIEGLLVYSRLDAPVSLNTVDCEEVLQRVIANLKLAIEQSGAEITHSPLPVIMSDQSQLVQLFQNLINNSIKFKREEPLKIHISAKKSGDEWFFSVKDNAEGIDPQYKDKIFLLFQRLHGREYTGVGIGLSICKKIVERFGGRIWVESEIGEGSIFYFTILDKRS